MPLLAPDDPQLVLSADALFAPNLLAPPDEWFTEVPEWLAEVDKVWIDSEGRVAARTWQAGSCLIDGNESECWNPVVSPTEYEAFHQGSQPVRSGAVLPVGVIGGGVGHAPTNLTFDQAARWYARPHDQLMVGRAFDVPGDGGYFLGAVLPHLTVAQVAMVRRSALSCDWRYRLRDNAGRPLNSYDNIGPWLVSRPGLPLDRRGSQTFPKLRFKSKAASAGEPPCFFLDYDETEAPMFCQHCGKPTADGHTHEPCTDCGPPAQVAAATTPTGVLDNAPTTAPAPAEAPPTDTVSRAEFDALAAVVDELAAQVAQMMVDDLQVDDLYATPVMG